MATLIPALGSCTARMTSGERRLAQRLEQQLDDDYLLWYDVPMGPKQTQPDFVVLHPGRGLLILETKDWRLETISRATRQIFEIVPEGRVKVVINPLAQARHGAIQVVRELERDAQLIAASGPHQGKLLFPWGHGVVFTRITRRQFEAAGLADAMEPDRVICSDEMPEGGDPEAFQQRLWQMFPHAFGGLMTLPQLDRVRWLMFPDVRVPLQQGLFDARPEAELPDVMQVMDLQQEQLARSLGEGHRVIHGVAGSGKTMILGYRAEYLARAAAASAKPILVLCFNEPLGTQLASHFEAKGLADRVHARHFHRWCRQQLVAFGQDVPPQGPQLFDAMVEGVIRGVARGHIPAGQYQAVLIDEGHDFRPEWLKLVAQMVDPTTNSLLVLYDDAQNIYGRRARAFSFKSVGIQAQGRTTILKINYRNTRQILALAHRVAAELLQPHEVDEDGVPLIRPVSGGREGREPLVVRLPNLRDEALTVAQHLQAAHEEGHAWGEMAVICPDHDVLGACATALRRLHLPHQVRRRSGEFKPSEDVIHVLTLKVSKGLEFPVVAMPGVAQIAHATDGDEAEAARLFYVGATRATHRLLVTVSGEGALAQRLGV